MVGLTLCWGRLMLSPTGWCHGQLEVGDPIPWYLGLPFTAPWWLGGKIIRFEAALRRCSGLLWYPSDPVAYWWKGLWVVQDDLKTITWISTSRSCPRTDTGEIPPIWVPSSWSPVGNPGPHRNRLQFRIYPCAPWPSCIPSWSSLHFPPRNHLAPFCLIHW